MIGVVVGFQYGNNFDEPTNELRERVAGLYGVRPSIEFVQIANLVENIRP